MQRRRSVKALHRYLRARAEHPLAATHLAEHLWLGQGSALPFGYNGIRLMLIRRCKKLGYCRAKPTRLRPVSVIVRWVTRPGGRNPARW